MADAANCLVCGDVLALDRGDEGPRAVVYCTDCGTPHHQDCFAYGGQCAVYACGCMRYSRRGQRGRDVSTIVVGGERPRKPARPVTERLVMDLDTPLEQFFSGLAVACAMGAFLTLMSGMDRKSAGVHWDVVGGFAAAGAVAGMLRWATDCYYILDCASKQVLYHRRFLGVTRLHPVMTFGEALAVELTARRRWRSGTKSRSGRYYTEYRLELVGGDGRRHLVHDTKASDENGRRDLIEQAGRKAASLIGRPFRARFQPFDTFSECWIPVLVVFGLIGTPALVIGGAGALIFAALFTWLVTTGFTGALIASDDGRE